MMPAMRFEKWQALGNDYLIVERAELPFELTPERVKRLCHPHFGPGADGVLELSPADDPGFVARLRIFNPDGSEAELSGNGAREAILYLRRRGWTEDDEFSIQTKAGPIRPTIVGPTTCRVQMGRAALRSRDFPGGPEDGSGELEIDGRAWRFQHVSIGNPQCSIRVAGPNELAGLDLDELGPAIETLAALPEPHERLVLVRARARRDPRADLRARGGGDALVRDRGVRARPSRTCSTAASRRSPCTWTAASSRSRSRRSSTSSSPAGRCPSTAASSASRPWPPSPALDEP